jgi:uncharacterized protein (UPF0335 family)
LHLIETGEDMEKDLVTVAPQELREYVEKIAKLETAEIHTR